MKAHLVSKKDAEKKDTERTERKSTSAKKKAARTDVEPPDRTQEVEDVPVNPSKMKHVMAKVGQGDPYPDNADEKAERAELNEAAEEEADADAAEARSRGDTSEGLDVPVPKKTQKPEMKATLSKKEAGESTKVVMIKDVETCRAGNITLHDTGYTKLKQGKAYMLPMIMALVLKDSGAGVIADEVEEEEE